jgi:hypothetical protein
MHDIEIWRCLIFGTLRAQPLALNKSEQLDGHHTGFILPWVDPDPFLCTPRNCWPTLLGFSVPRDTTDDCEAANAPTS